MADYRDTFTSEIYVNQTQAQDAVEKYTKKLADLNKQLAEIDKSEDGWEKKEKKLQRQIKSTEGTLKGVQTGVENYQKAINSLDGRSINNLIKLKKQLNAEIRKLVPGTEEYINRTKDLKKVEARINSLTKATQSMSTRITSWFGKYWEMFDTLSRTITGLSMKFRQSAEDAAKLDDVYSDVMKTTGLLHEEVEALDKALMQINTRTSREQLLLLARDAGKLGIQGKENILGFVRAADQIQVALGEDLGEGAIRNLGKIADVLGYTQSMGIEKSLLSIASAVNAVGQASTASEGYLVDFTQRLAGVAAQTNISAADIIGFASGLDQSAMKVEMAATAFQKFLMKLYEDPAKFAEYANMEVKEFSDLLANDANTAIITVLKSLKDKDGFGALVPIFKDMGLDGARAVSVLAAMATNINAVTEAQALANVEFAKATSVTEEYNTKNNNLQARLEKARKEFKNASIALGQSLNPVLLKSTNLVTYLIKALAKYGKEIKAAAIAIAVLTAAVKASTIAHTVYNTVVKGIVAVQKTFTVVVNAASYAINLMRGRTIAATKAYLAMKAAMSTSVFGAIATAVTALVVVITRLINKEKEAANAMSYVQSVEKKVVETYAEEEARIKTLHAIVRDNNIALGQRKKALQELQELVPEYHASLDKEGKLIEGNTVFLDKYIEKLREATRWQVYKDEWQDLETQLINIQDKLAEARQKAQEELTRNGGNATEKYTMEVDTWGGGTKMEETYTEYGKLMRTVRFYEDEETKVLNNQEAIRGRMAQLTHDETQELSAMEKEIQVVQQKYELLFNEAKNAYIGAPAEGAKALGKLQEQMDAEIAAIRKKYAQPVTPDGGGGGGGGGEDGNDAAQKKAFDARIKAIQQQYKTEEREAKLSLLRQEIDQAEYESRIYNAKAEYFRQKIEAARQYCQDETEIMNEFYDWQIQAIEKSNKQQQDILDALAKVDRARKKKEEDEQLQEMQNLGKRLEREQEILEKDLARVKERIGKDTWKEELAFEMWKLEELHNRGLVSEKDYQLAKLKIKMEYAQKAAEQTNSIAEYASDFVAQLKEMETAQLEAEYQAQLTAAGDNAEEREAIETEYEQKKLDLQKKYADTEMVINIAKAIAAGALAAIEAFAAAGNPILGAVFAAMIAATTALEVATIVKQRNAIKNSSVSGGSSSSAPSTGQRTITGHAKGGFTENHTTLSTVGEEGVEWIAPHWMVRDNPTTFANLERYRKTGSHGRSGSVSSGFADGGFTGATPDNITSGGTTTADIEAAVETAIERSFARRAIRAYVVRRDIKELDDQDDRLANQTSRG